MDETNQPFVLSGQPGIGKSTLISKAASDVTSYIQQDGMSVLPCVVTRYIGTSPSSSTLRHLLRSICEQLAFVTKKLRHALPTDFKLLKKWFQRFLTQGDFPGIVVLFLDGLDLLVGGDSGCNIDWLPAKIAKNVKVIVSCISDGRILSKLQSKITNERYHYELKEMELSECSELLSNGLTSRGRIINFVQWRLVKEMFTKCASPLYVKLLFEEVLQWKAYTQVEPSTIATGVDACINVIFDRLERKHSHAIASRALGYVTATQSGISESELCDVMSLDNHVLNAVYRTWDRPVRRIPAVIVARICADIRGFVTERDVDETTVFHWYHHHFATIATQRYLSQCEETANEIHSNMADLFLGKWSRMKRKPFVYNDQLARKLRVKSAHSSAVRYVPEQPLVYNTYNTEARYNYRKLNQLPYHLAKAGRNEDLYGEVLFNYDWLITKLKACSASHLIADYGLAPNREVALVVEVLRMCEAALAETPEVLCVELTGRLLSFYNTHANIRKLIVQCDTAAMRKCPIVPNWQV